MMEAWKGMKYRRLCQVLLSCELVIVLLGETDRYQHRGQRRLPGLPEGERGEGHDLYCDGGLEGYALAGAAQL